MVNMSGFHMTRPWSQKNHNRLLLETLPYTYLPCTYIILLFRNKFYFSPTTTATTTSTIHTWDQTRY